VSAKQLKALIFKQRLLAMGVRIKWALESTGESVRGFVRNTLIYRVLLLIFWSAAFLLPWLLLVSAYMLKVFVDLIGKEPSFGSSNKATD
jgi:hypothetical protein